MLKIGSVIDGKYKILHQIGKGGMSTVYLAINEKANEVRQLLAVTKAQYEKFGVVLEKAGKKIEEAGRTLDDARKRNDIIRRKLKTIDAPTADEADRLLGIEDTAE